MARLSLKSIIRKDAEVEQLLTSLLQKMMTPTAITDENRNILLGNKENSSFEYPILIDNEKIGFVTGDQQSTVIVNIITVLIRKEQEKKKLGTEVLNLYKEINLIFNFSEKLAQAIDAPSICSITLQEAANVIHAEQGVILLWNEKDKRLQLMSSTAENFFEESVVNVEKDMLFRIVFSGHSEIITHTEPLVKEGIISAEVTSLIYSALKVNQRLVGAIVLGTVKRIQYTAADLKLLTTLALQSSAAIESSLLYEKNLSEARDREEAMRLVYEATGKFVPYEFIGSLGHKLITDIKLGDQVEKVVTVLFCDMRDYTTLSEKMSPGENFRFICSFNERVGPIIRRHNGFINQYLGDAIMAIFPGNAADALAAAIGIQREVEVLNESGRVTGQKPIQVGIGMHTGSLIMGITGDKERMDAATISDTVNTASRIESLTKHYKASVLLSDSSLVQINNDDYHFRYLGLVQLKGKQEPLHIYECFNSDPEEQIRRKQETLSLFQDGIRNYLNSMFSNSAKCFETILEINPEDRTAAFFRDTARKYLEKEVPENWSGVVEMSMK
jgi:adenylate cyclase